MSKPLDIEQRAAEIAAAIHHEYLDGGWFACMTRDERRGWDIHDDECWTGDLARYRAPTSARMHAGWLAREIAFTFNMEWTL